MHYNVTMESRSFHIVLCRADWEGEESFYHTRWLSFDTDRDIGTPGAKSCAVVNSPTIHMSAGDLRDFFPIRVASVVRQNLTRTRGARSRRLVR
jgi:hypothetical protein